MSAATAAMSPVRGVDRANMDPSVPPSQDFYQFSNGSWLRANPIPDEYSRWGAFEAVHELTQAQLRAILESCAAGPQTDTHRRLAGALYRSGMDAAARESAGLRGVLGDAYEAVEAARSAEELVVVVARLRVEFGVSAPGLWRVADSADAKNSGWCVLHVSQGGLGIGDRDFYLEEDKEEVRGKYVAHLGRLLGLMGFAEGEREAMADKVMALETRMAAGCMTRTERRDPHKTYNKFAGAQELAEKTESQNVPWGEYFDVLGLSGDDYGGIVLDNVVYAKTIGELLADPAVALDVWKAYVKIHVTTSMSPYLCTAFVEEHFAFHIRDMSGQPKMKELWKRVAAQVGDAVEESLGTLYVERHFSEAAKAACKEMVDLIARVVGERFEGLQWMGPETKKRAAQKLERFRAKIAYPDVWDVAHCESLAEEVAADKPFGLNIRAALRSDMKRTLARINKPIDKERWFMVCPLPVDALHSLHTFQR